MHRLSYYEAAEVVRLSGRPPILPLGKNPSCRDLATALGMTVHDIDLLLVEVRRRSGSDLGAPSELRRNVLFALAGVAALVLFSVIGLLTSLRPAKSASPVPAAAAVATPGLTFTPPAAPSPAFVAPTNPPPTPGIGAKLVPQAAPEPVLPDERVASNVASSPSQVRAITHETELQKAIARAQAYAGSGSNKPTNGH